MSGRLRQSKSRWISDCISSHHYLGCPGFAGSFLRSHRDDRGDKLLESLASGRDPDRTREK
jgi:hypothetical protein